MKDVTAAIMIEDGRVLIARRCEGDPLAGQWEFPGGKVEPGESPEACLERELEEELGISSRVLAKLGESIYRYEHGAFRLLAYYVQRLEGELVCHVHDELAWVAIADLGDYPLLPADLPLVELLVADLDKGADSAYHS